MQKTYTPDQVAAFLTDVAAYFQTNPEGRLTAEVKLIDPDFSHEFYTVIQVNIKDYNDGAQVFGTANIFEYEADENSKLCFCGWSNTYFDDPFDPDSDGIKPGFDKQEELLYLKDFFQTWLSATYDGQNLVSIDILQ